MQDEDRYISVKKAARLAHLTERQVTGMCSVKGSFRLRHKYTKRGKLLIHRDSLTELFLGYTGGWD